MTNEYPIWAEYLPHKKRYIQKTWKEKKEGTKQKQIQKKSIRRTD
jgi:hypothetical protein